MISYQTSPSQGLTTLQKQSNYSQVTAQIQQLLIDTPLEDFDAQLKQRLELFLLQSINSNGVVCTLPLNKLEEFFDFCCQLVNSFALHLESFLELVDTLLTFQPEQSLKAVSSCFTQALSVITYKPATSSCYQKILKISNQILRRLSASHNTSIRGLVLKLVSEQLPICHRSGVNLTGKYQIDFKIESNPEQQEEQTEHNEFSSAFYNNFWLLQQYLQDPIKIFKNEEQIKILSDCSKSDKSDWNDKGEDFQDYKPEEADKKNNLEIIVHEFDKIIEYFKSKPIRGDRATAKIQKKYPKHLTKESLLSLQLNDFNFRYNFILQFLILFQNFENPSSRTQIEAIKLTDSEKKKVSEVRAKALKLLGDEGETSIVSSFVRKPEAEKVDLIMKREKFWVRMACR